MLAVDPGTVCLQSWKYFGVFRAEVKLIERFKLLEEAAGNGHIVCGLRICEGFLKPVS